MAYCPNCAAVLDPGLKFCSRCGQASGVTAAPPPPISMPPYVSGAVGANEGVPANVKIAAAILVVAVLVSAFSVFTFLARYPTAATPEYLMRVIGFDILWLLFTVGLWMRQNWARFATLVLVLWGAGQLLVNLIRFSGRSSSGAFAFVVPICLAALHIGAAVLIFSPSSNAWFKK